MSEASDLEWPASVLAGAASENKRWLLWLGVAFILCVYFFPTGIVGRLRQRR